MTYAQPFVIALLNFAILVPAGSAAEGHKWTPESALEALQQRNMTLKAARSEVEYAGAQQSEAVALWLPRGEFKGSAGVSPGYKGSALAGYQDDEDWGPVIRGGVDAGIPLFAFGQLLVVQELAHLGVEVAEAKMALRLQQVTLEMEEALVQVQQVESRMAAIEGWKARLTHVRGLFTSEEARAQDPSIESRLDLLEADIERQLAVEARAKASLVRTVLGLLHDPEGELAVPELKPSVIPAEVSGSRCIDLALDRRADFLVGRTMLELGEVNLLLSRLRFLPGFALVANYSRRFAPSDTNQVGAFRSDPRNGGGLGALLAAEWDLDLPKRWRELETAHGKLSAGKHQLTFALADGLYQVSKSFRDALSAQVRRASGEESLLAARAWYEEASTRFSNGVGTPEDVFDSYRAFSKSELEWIDSLGFYETSIDRLRAHVGGECWVGNPLLDAPP